MAVTEGKYNLVLKGKYNSDDHINSFYYDLHFDGGTLVGDDDELGGVAKRWWDYIKEDWSAAVTNAMHWLTVEVFKADGVDVGASGFYSIPLDEQTNDSAQDALPPFVAYSFQYTRPNANFRHGYKRLSGVPEPWNVNGVLNSTGLAVVNTLAATLAGDVGLNDALVNRPYMEPILVQRVKNGLPVDPDVWYKPSTVVYKKLGSQNSRKFNVGS